MGVAAYVLTVPLLCMAIFTPRSSRIGFAATLLVLAALVLNDAWVVNVAIWGVLTGGRLVVVIEGWS